MVVLRVASRQTLLWSCDPTTCCVHMRTFQVAMLNWWVKLKQGLVCQDLPNWHSHRTPTHQKYRLHFRLRLLVDYFTFQPVVEQGSAVVTCGNPPWHHFIPPLGSFSITPSSGLDADILEFEWTWNHEFAIELLVVIENMDSLKYLLPCSGTTNVVVHKTTAGRVVSYSKT